MACGEPDGAKCAGTQTASTPGVTALAESFFQALIAGDQKASLASFSIALPIPALRGLPPPRLGSYYVDWCVSHLKGHPGCGPTL